MKADLSAEILMKAETSLLKDSFLPLPEVAFQLLETGFSLCSLHFLAIILCVSY
jgi:hypothetical protein